MAKQDHIVVVDDAEIRSLLREYFQRRRMIWKTAFIGWIGKGVL